jgi:hypothetical protein
MPWQPSQHDTGRRKMDRSTELNRLMAEYRVMEKEMARLEETKKELRAAIQRLLEEEGKSAYAAVVNGEPIVLELKTHTEIRYDENLLIARLGRDYDRILQPDIAKIRRHLVELGPVLAPHLEKIGSPSRLKIRQLVSSGEIPIEAFRGAFQKIQKTILFVKKYLPLPDSNQ